MTLCPPARNVLAAGPEARRIMRAAFGVLTDEPLTNTHRTYTHRQAAEYRNHARHLRLNRALRAHRLAQRRAAMLIVKTERDRARKLAARRAQAADRRALRAAQADA